MELYSAVFRRRSYRAPFSLHEISGEALAQLADSGATDGAGVRAVQGQADVAVPAGLLAGAARVLRDDRAYQRELVAWTAQFLEPLPDASALPWAGLVRERTRLPDRITLIQRVLVVLTPGVAGREHLLAGAALERIWLRCATS